MKKYKESLTSISECGIIRHMTLEERTIQYVTRRSAELRGDIFPPTLDQRTEKYIIRRLAELRGEVAPGPKTAEHPYIKRRLAELRRKPNETETN